MITEAVIKENIVKIIAPISDNKCVALIHSRKIGEAKQCTNRKKDGLDFCGVHCKVKKVTRYETFIQHKPPVAPKNDQTSVLKSLSIKELRNMAKEINLKIDCRMTKPYLLKALITHYANVDKYTDSGPQIIKLQAMARGFNMRNRMKCVNKTDISTLDLLCEIPSRYFFRFKDSDGFYYGFDIRSFKNLLDSQSPKTPTNPYNWKPLSADIIQKYRGRWLDLMLSDEGVDAIADTPYKSNPEKEMEHYMVKVFHKFDMLDNYTDHLWFKNLSMLQLKKLYKECEDIWNYRAGLTQEAKKILVKNGIAFPQSIHKILAMSDTPSNKLKLQSIILNEFEKLLDQGETLGDRKTSAKLMITGLVSVSDGAAQAYPYLVWSMASPVD